MDGSAYGTKPVISLKFSKVRPLGSLVSPGTLKDMQLPLGAAEGKSSCGRKTLKGKALADAIHLDGTGFAKPKEFEGVIVDRKRTGALQLRLNRF